MATTVSGTFVAFSSTLASALIAAPCRLNKIYREAVSEEDILAILRPMIKSYALERLDGEHFGDFVIRKGIISATTEGKAFCASSRRLLTPACVANLAPSADDNMCPQ